MGENLDFLAHWAVVGLLLDFHGESLAGLGGLGGLFVACSKPSKPCLKSKKGKAHAQILTTHHNLKNNQLKCLALFA
jgi:hypothetical protein